MAPAPSRGVILTIEDPFVCSFLKIILERRGYTVMEKGLGSAMALLDPPDSPVSLVITNQPRHFEPYAHRVAILYLAAIPEPAQVACFPASRVLRKPFLPDDLFAAVAELVGSGVAQPSL